jgi:hypothetical protein
MNGASTLRILLHHKAGIGFRTGEKVVVFESRSDGDEDEELKARSFDVLLCEPRDIFDELCRSQHYYFLEADGWRRRTRLLEAGERVTKTIPRAVLK